MYKHFEILSRLYVIMLCHIKFQTQTVMITEFKCNIFIAIGKVNATFFSICVEI